MKFFRSSDTRLRSDVYEREGLKLSCLIEDTQYGLLVTEFNERGLVETQRYYKGEKWGCMLDLGVLSAKDAEIVDCGMYSCVKIDSKCTACSGEIARELDLLHPSIIGSVPIVPSFVCKKCSKKFYSMTDNYLKGLVGSKNNLFEEKDLKELKEDEEGFVHTLQEYIIRIFASKKITKIR